MTAPDIVTEAREWIEAPGPCPQCEGSKLMEVGYDDPMGRSVTEPCGECVRLVTDLVAEVERLRQQVEGHEKVVDWADDALARRDARITELIAERDAALAEVERLRHRDAALTRLLDAVGDADNLRLLADTFDLPYLRRIAAAVEDIDREDER